jgi:hypothetical protein
MVKILKNMFKNIIAKLTGSRKTKVANDVNAAKESEQKKESTGPQ